jgi:hypothetical protein
MHRQTRSARLLVVTSLLVLGDRFRWKRFGWHVPESSKGVDPGWRGAMSTGQRATHQGSDFRLQTSDFRHSAPSTRNQARLLPSQLSALSFCPTIFLSFAFPRDRSARFQEQLGQQFYYGHNSQPSTLRPIFLPNHLFAFCLHSGSRCALSGTAGTAVLQWAQPSTLRPIFLPNHLFAFHSLLLALCS